MAEVRWFPFEGRIKFNLDWVASKTLREFMEHERHHGLTDKQYKDIHAACCKLAKKGSDKKSVDKEQDS